MIVQNLWTEKEDGEDTAAGKLADLIKGEDLKKSFPRN